MNGRSDGARGSRAKESAGSTCRYCFATDWQVRSIEGVCGITLSVSDNGARVTVYGIARCVALVVAGIASTVPDVKGVLIVC